MSTPNPLAQAPAGLEKAVSDYEAGDIAAATATTLNLLEQHPNDYAVLYFAATLALVAHRFADAQRLFERALESTRDNRQQALSWNGLGHTGKNAGNLDLAEEAFRRAMLLDPTSIDHALEFAEILTQKRKLDPALDVQRSTMLRHPNDPRSCVGAGNTLLLSNRQRDALVFYDMALRRDPNYAPAHFNASVALTMLGELDAARTACEITLKLDPTLEGYYQLATLGALHAGDERLPWLEDRLTKEGAPIGARVDAGFALAQVYDRSGDTDRAFAALQRANALKRSTLDYDVKRDEARVDRIMAFFTRDLIERFKAASDSTLAPIFIIGMPRSGTTLVEQMLAAHPKIKAGGELPHMPELAKKLGDLWGSRGDASPGTDEQVKADLRHAADSYARLTAGLSGSAQTRFTDKLTGNFLIVGLIHLMYPRARFIHCRRDPMDTCLSCYQHLFSSDVPFSYDLTELGVYYRLYRRLMDHWRTTLPAGFILDVDYEKLVAEPETGVRDILEFCGLEFDPACLKFQDVGRAVTTASAVQVRRPIYGTSVHRSEKYRAHLGPLLAAMDPQTG